MRSLNWIGRVLRRKRGLVKNWLFIIEGKRGILNGKFFLIEWIIGSLKLSEILG